VCRENVKGKFAHESHKTLTSRELQAKHENKTLDKTLYEYKNLFSF